MVHEIYTIDETEPMLIFTDTFLCWSNFDMELLLTIFYRSSSFCMMIFLIYVELDTICK